MGGDLQCQEASGGFKMVHNKGRIVSALVSVSRRGLYPLHSCSTLLLLLAILMPSETLLVEGDDDLGTLVIGLLSKHEVRLVGVFPVERDRGTLLSSLIVTRGKRLFI